MESQLGFLFISLFVNTKAQVTEIGEIAPGRFAYCYGTGGLTTAEAQGVCEQDNRRLMALESLEIYTNFMNLITPPISGCKWGWTAMALPSSSLNADAIFVAYDTSQLSGTPVKTTTFTELNSNYVSANLWKGGTRLLVHLTSLTLGKFTNYDGTNSELCVLCETAQSLPTCPGPSNVVNTADAITADPCPNGLAKLGTRSGCFWIVKEDRTWETAQEDCKANGGRLFEPKSRDILNLVIQELVIPTVEIDNFWVGERYDGEKWNLAEEGVVSTYLPSVQEKGSTCGYLFNRTCFDSIGTFDCSSTTLSYYICQIESLCQRYIKVPGYKSNGLGRIITRATASDCGKSCTLALGCVAFQMDNNIVTDNCELINIKPGDDDSKTYFSTPADTRKLVYQREF